MRVPSSVQRAGIEDPAVCLSAGQRASQKGLETAAQNLKASIAGTGITKNDVVMIVDVWPTSLGEWAHGCFELQLQKLQDVDGNIPSILYPGSITYPAEMP